MGGQFAFFQQGCTMEHGASAVADIAQHMFDQLLAEIAAGIAGQFIRQVAYGHDIDASRKVGGCFFKGFPVNAVNRIADGAVTQIAGNGTVVIVGDIGDGIHTECRIKQGFPFKEPGNILVPVNTVDQDIGMGQVVGEGTVVLLRMAMEFIAVVIAAGLMSVKQPSFEMYIHRVLEIPVAVIFGFHLMDAQQVHDFENTVRHASASRYGDFDFGQVQPEIGMDEFLETVYRMHGLQAESSGSATIGHDAIVRSHNTGKKAEADDAGTVFVLKAFIIDQGDFFFGDSFSQFLIVRLQLLGMGEEEIRLSCNQLAHRNFLDAQQHTAEARRAARSNSQ